MMKPIALGGGEDGENIARRFMRRHCVRIGNTATVGLAKKVHRLEIGFQADQPLARLPVVAAFDTGNETVRFDGLGPGRSDCRGIGRIEVPVVAGRSARIVLPPRRSCADAGIEAAPIVEGRTPRRCHVGGISGGCPQQRRDRSTAQKKFAHNPPRKKSKDHAAKQRGERRERLSSVNWTMTQTANLPQMWQNCSNKLCLST
jgi:hypothetical protein